jgi:hypothetical protein
MGLVDLDHRDPAREERAHERGGVGAGRLHSDPQDLTMALQPVGELPVAARRGRECPGGQKPALLVEHRGVVGVGVRVDPAGDAEPGWRHHGHAVLPVRAGRAGSGGHNSDEALVGSRFL